MIDSDCRAREAAVITCRGCDCLVGGESGIRGVIIARELSPRVMRFIDGEQQKHIIGGADNQISQ